MKKALTLLLALMMAASMAACSSTNTSTPASASESESAAAPLDPIKIGAVLSQTGTVAHAGINAQRAIELLLEDVNANGGIKGRQVALSVENCNTEPEKAASLALKLANDTKVLAIMGPDNTSTATAVKEQVAEVEEIVCISVTGSSPKLTADNPQWYFRGATPSKFQCASMVQYLVEEKGYTKFAIMTDSTLTDQSDAFAATLTEYNIEPLTIQEHASGDTNFNGQLLAIKPYEPEVIAFFGYVTECAGAVKQAHDMGIEAQFAGGIGIVYQELCDLGGENVEGVIGTIGFTASNPDPAVQAFTKAFQDKYGETPDHAAGQAYDQMKLVLQAIEECDLSFDEKDLAADRKLIRDWLENSSKGIQGLSGVISYTPEDHTAYKMVNVMVIESGAWKVLKASSAN